MLGLRGDDAEVSDDIRTHHQIRPALLSGAFMRNMRPENYHPVLEVTMTTDAKLVTPEAAAPPMDWKENVRDLTAGGAGGVAQVLIGMERQLHEWLLLLQISLTINQANHLVCNK